MLWTNLYTESNLLCGDLVKNSSNIFNTTMKNNELSIDFRLKGNSKIANSDYSAALKLYNKSLRFAQSSELISLGYANRSYCYFKLELFDQCLIDVEYAKAQEHFPINLSVKLDKRKQLCLEQIKSRTESRHNEPILSYKANSKLPAIADVLDIEINQEFGRLVKAKRDINIGDTLLIEKAYVRSSTADECFSCFKSNVNLVPCVKCVDVMYCNKECADNDFHSIECNKKVNSDNPLHGSFIIRSLVLGINNFETINELMEFVKHMQSTDEPKIIEQCDTPIAKYRTFLNLSTFITEAWIEDFRKEAVLIYHAIMSSEKFADKFNTQEKKDFLISLVFHHAAITRTNAFGGISEPPDQFSEIVNHPTDGSDDYERNIFLITSHINHSCLPNVTKLSKGHLAIVKAIQPIKSGDQLFVSYLAGDLVERLSVDRNAELKSGYGFQCKCELCVSGEKKNFFVLEKDSDFLFVACNVNNYQNLIIELKKRCIAFIQRHPNSIASKPGYFILNTLTAMLQKEIDFK